MTEKTHPKAVIAPKEAAGKAVDLKIERALEVREAAAKLREGKPMAFPTHRVRA